jgi:hypothetical protein
MRVPIIASRLGSKALRAWTTDSCHNNSLVIGSSYVLFGWLKDFQLAFLRVVYCKKGQLLTTSNANTILVWMQPQGHLCEPTSALKEKLSLSF